MSATPEQLLLLADDIKLSLLERQRSQDLGLAPSSEDSVAASLDQLRRGIEALQQDKSLDASDAAETLPHLEALLSTLTTQHHGFASASPATADSNPSPTPRAAKNVRFSDTPTSPSDELFGRYRDDPANESEGYRDVAAQMDNQQVYDYHNQIMEEQDEHLDRLGESIGRQRELSMQIGDELDSHVAMLDEVDGVVDRHQSRLDRAKRTLGSVARTAGQNMQMTTIIALIVILILLIAVLK